MSGYPTNANDWCVNAVSTALLSVKTHPLSQTTNIVRRIESITKPLKPSRSNICKSVSNINNFVSLVIIKMVEHHAQS